MINVWLSVPSPEGEAYEEMATTCLSSKRPMVVYEATLSRLRKYAGRMTGLFIPRKLQGADYNFEYLIEHIRIDEDPNIAQVRIAVCLDPSDEFLQRLNPISGFQERRYQELGVVLTIEPSAGDFTADVDVDAWEEYRRVAGMAPRYGKGRHDQANEWGAYVVLTVLSRLNCGDEAENLYVMDQARRLEQRLLEDTYFKKRIQRLRGATPDAKLLGCLKWERAQLLKRINASGAILVVEDQLSDGWQAVYSSIFGVEGASDRLLFAADVEAAKACFVASPMLIMLDVRLDADRGIQCQDEGEQRIEELAGVRLAEWFNRKRNTAPIIAATASNKSWTLEALLGYGINSYWIKGSPDSTATWGQAIRNVLDLYKKLNETLEWSQKTRSWVEGLYSIADIVLAYDQVNGRRIFGKANSLHALLFQSFSPFQKQMSEGLQLNMAFILIYSCMNDLVGWILEKEEGVAEGAITWYLDGDDGRCAIVTATAYIEKTGDMVWKYLRHETDEKPHDFPDSGAALDVLNGFRLTLLSKRFRELAKIRNGLPLIHGKADHAGTTSKSVDRVSESKIHDLIDVLLTLAKEKHGRLSGQARTR